VFCFLLFSFNAISQRRYYEYEVIGDKDTCWYYFDNELSELFYNWIENDKKLTSKKRSRIDGSLTVVRPDGPISQDILSGYEVYGVKFKISFSEVNEKMYSEIRDTLYTNYHFTKSKDYGFDSNIESEIKLRFEFKKSYLLKSNYKRAEYLIELNGEKYHLKITRQNRRQLIMKNIKKSEIPLFFLEEFIGNVSFTYDCLKDYNFNYGFSIIHDDD
jgi:hypothetical protein